MLPLNRRPALAVAAAKPVKKKRDKGDFTIAALGITLGLTCALFPWYIFYNQEKFGIREFVFDGHNSSTQRSFGVGSQRQVASKPFSSDEIPQMGLDFFPTATLPSGDEPARVIPSSDQPYPADRVDYRLVHVANGRAMIEDPDGLWVVQRGSRLPDASRVASIEQRKGKWVLVTNRNQVVELTR